MSKIISALLKWAFNLWSSGRVYFTEWVEDLPGQPQKNTIYIVGGRKHPFAVVIPCVRRNCQQVIHLDISSQVAEDKRWYLNEDKGGRISLSPSIHLTALSCHCHYWLRQGRVIWCESPPFFVPKENRNDTRSRS